MKPKIPYGYQIINGEAVVQAAEAEKLKKFFEAYVGGATIAEAKKESGVERSVAGCRLLLNNPVYLGTDFFPRLLSDETMKTAERIRLKRGSHLYGKAGIKTSIIPVQTRFAGDAPDMERLEIGSPVEAAVYAYGLIGNVAENSSQVKNPGSEKKRKKNVGGYKGQVPYGLEKYGKGLRASEPESTVLKRIFAFALDGRSGVDIADILNREKIPSARGGEWSQGAVRHILHNPVYVKEGLVSKEDFQDVQAGIKARNKKESQERIRSPFRGKVICGRCGEPMYRQNRKYPAYVCKGGSDCRNGSIREEELQESFISCLGEIEMDRLLALADESEWLEKAGWLADIEWKIRQQQEKAVEIGKLPLEEYLADENLRLQRAAVEENLKKLMKAKADGEGTPTCFEKVQELAAFLETWDDAFPEEAFPEIIEKILVAAKEKTTFFFACGLEAAITKENVADSGGIEIRYKKKEKEWSGFVASADIEPVPIPVKKTAEEPIEIPMEDTYMAVRVIKATKTQSAEAPLERRMKVACYARVSTDSEEQESSYEAQIDHYTRYISSHPEWEFAGMYADEGISGTQAKKRTEFNRLIADCEAGKIEMVITKSISRWARNTLESLEYIRKLKALGIGILFEKESIYTLDAKGEVLITILSSLAQQESQSISQNVRMGLQYRMQEGKGSLNTDRFLGFRKKEGNKYEYEIVPEEAETVRRIYREYLDGYSALAIARHLENDGILSPAGLKKWHANTVDSILRNEKYCGDLLLQKYYVEDFLTHKLVKNTGQLPQYFVEGHHDKIVPKEIYSQVRGEAMRRRKETVKTRSPEDKPLSGKVYCGKCGRVMYRVAKKGVPAWCFRDISGDATPEEKACHCRTVSEPELKSVVISALNELPGMWETLVRKQAAIWNGDLKRIDALIAYNRDHEDDESHIAERNRLLLERAESANDEMHIRLLLEFSEIMRGTETESSTSPECTDYEDFFKRTRPEIRCEGGKITEYTPDLVTRYIDRIIVDDIGYKVVFKGGVTVEVGKDIGGEATGEVREGVSGTEEKQKMAV